VTLRASRAARLTFFRSADRGLHAAANLIREPAKHEARKRRASVRPRVGCCEELCRRSLQVQPESLRRWSPLQDAFEMQSSLTARRAVSLLLLTIPAIGRGAGDWSSFAGTDWPDRAPMRCSGQFGRRLRYRQTKWNDFDQVGVKTCSSMHAWCWLLLQKHRT